MRYYFQVTNHLVHLCIYLHFINPLKFRKLIRFFLHNYNDEIFAQDNIFKETSKQVLSQIVDDFEFLIFPSFVVEQNN